MARFDVGGLDAMMEAMNLQAARIERNGSAAVEAGAKVLQAALKEAAPVRTGGLRDHIKISKPKHNSIDGYFVDVYPDGKNARGERYATIGSVLEYGRSNMPAQPWLRPTSENQGQAVGEAMAAELMKD